MNVLPESEWPVFCFFILYFAICVKLPGLLSLFRWVLQTHERVLGIWWQVWAFLRSELCWSFLKKNDTQVLFF
jgi:hypothetical protein